MKEAHTVPKKVIIHWFRRDLRLDDNRGLDWALAEASKIDAVVLPLFIFDRDILSRLEDPDDARVTFIRETLESMNEVLSKDASGIFCLIGECASIWKQLVSKDSSPLPRDRFHIVAVSCNHDYEPAARARDAAVEKILKANRILFQSFKDQVIFEKSEVTKDDGKPYTVFTPYSKKWLARLDAQLLGGEQVLTERKSASRFSTLIRVANGEPLCIVPSYDKIGFSRNKKINFPTKKIKLADLSNYASLRDLPFQDATSRIGLHLRFGTVSIRNLVAVARHTSAHVWLNELIWREFFMQILWNFPSVVEYAFRPAYDQISWRNNETEFEAWCTGTTGYPLVDAGMRELNATGFMHNRVRMVAGSFLVKHLLIDWRWGEAYFARKLLDFELSSNNGNWQWVAGSGCDAAPYFRIFNPELQLRRFDPKMEYVRRWVPEYGTKDYPSPIVDHKQARARVLSAYAVVANKS